MKLDMTFPWYLELFFLRDIMICGRKKIWPWECFFRFLKNGCRFLANPGTPTFMHLLGSVGSHSSSSLLPILSSYTLKCLGMLSGLQVQLLDVWLTSGTLSLLPSFFFSAWETVICFISRVKSPHLTLGYYGRAFFPLCSGRITNQKEYLT